MDRRPIGIFDSGLGGLTAARALRARMPEEDILYFGDTGRMPYGPRPAEQLRRIAAQDMDYVASFGVKAIIAACGTVSSTAGDLLEQYRLPVFGVLKAGVEGLARAGGTGPAAVLATQASIDSGAYARAFSQAAPGRRLLSVACPALVPLIESGHTEPEDPALEEALEQYLAPVRAAGATALLLGCTHYSLIWQAVQRFAGGGTELVGAAECGAAALGDYLSENGLTGGAGRELYYTSGSVEEFTAAGTAFLGRSIEGLVRQAPVMEV